MRDMQGTDVTDKKEKKHKQGNGGKYVYITKTGRAMQKQSAQKQMKEHPEVKNIDKMYRVHVDAKPFGTLFSVLSPGSRGEAEESGVRVFYAESRDDAGEIVKAYANAGYIKRSGSAHHALKEMRYPGVILLYRNRPGEYAVCSASALTADLLLLRAEVSGQREKEEEH